MPFAENLNYLKEHYKLTKYELAKCLGCHQTSVKNWLEGTSVPYPKTQKKIADLFDITTEELNGAEYPHIKGENKLKEFLPNKKEKSAPISEGGSIIAL